MSFRYQEKTHVAYFWIERDRKAAIDERNEDEKDVSRALPKLQSATSPKPSHCLLILRQVLDLQSRAPSRCKLSEKTFLVLHFSCPFPSLLSNLYHLFLLSPLASHSLCSLLPQRRRIGFQVFRLGSCRFWTIRLWLLRGQASDVLRLQCRSIWMPMDHWHLRRWLSSRFHLYERRKRERDLFRPSFLQKRKRKTFLHILSISYTHLHPTKPLHPKFWPV